jgi:hypothetical protein
MIITCSGNLRVLVKPSNKPHTVCLPHNNLAIEHAKNSQTPEMRGRCGDPKTEVSVAEELPIPV